MTSHHSAGLEPRAYVLGRAQELRSCIAREHADDHHLAPLLHVNEQVAELPVVFVNQVDTFRTDLFKGHHYTARHQLEKQGRMM